jgi:hypothetical protein
MQKSFSLSNDNAMINFTAKYCDTVDKVLDSYGFNKVVTVYLEKKKNRGSLSYKFIEENLGVEDIQVTSKKIVSLFKILCIMNTEEAISVNEQYEKVLSDKEAFIDFVEDLYNFWRRLERYTIVQNNKITEGLESVSFIDANNQFTKLILHIYRKIEEKVLGYKPRVYRQLPAGANAGLILSSVNWSCPEGYKALKDIPFIDSVVLNPPFISYPKKNTREGYFTEVFENPLTCEAINKDHWFCYPAKIGSLLAFIYFHRDFMSHGVTLCNLFELAEEREYKGKNPDIIFVFGARDKETDVKNIFYDDVENNIMLGYENYSDKIDYFGYMKKMALTLHNLIMIKRGYLPVHGAMVNIVMKNGKSANVIIMGDSGAGKSESLEAFRGLSEDYISDMTVVFDDMGVVKPASCSKNKDCLNGRPLGYGTEIGAFVRLDDLDQGYAFKEIDRSIFMNPDKTNARLVMPVATYKEIIKGYPIDLFLYANNYEDVEDGKKAIEYFNTPLEAKSVFVDGARMAKGTTSEKGLVKSFFANPFGPYQRQKETEVLVDKYFEEFFKTGVKVGQIRTCLGIQGKESEGPRNAAIELFEIIKSL